MKKTNYLLLDLIIFISPFLGKLFYPSFIFPNLKAALLSIFFVSLIFIVWDIKVNNKWWLFNEKYITGIKIFDLPIEEIIFFPIVSFSCLIIWVNLNQVFKLEEGSSFLITVSFILLVIFLFLGFYFFKKKWDYSMTVSLIQGGTIILDWFLKTNLYLKIVFYLFLIIALFLTLIFNYYLTKRPVVIYPKKYKTEIRILTIPVEDFIYGMNFLTLVIIFYQLIKK